MPDRIESNPNLPDVIDELDYRMVGDVYKAGCMTEILANPTIHIYKNTHNKSGNINKEISVPIFI